MNEQFRIAVALSGGGVRALTFHAGVFKWLAEMKLLNSINQISSVSGGSLFVGLLFHINKMNWPNSEQYLFHVLPSIKRLLTNINLQQSTINLLGNPQNWIHALSRSNILEKSIEKTWGIKTRLSDLPVEPVWSVNGTTAENGRRFRFKRDSCGDYELGYADAGKFKLAQVMAASAAYPFLIGPVRIKTKKLKWHKNENWKDESLSGQSITIPYKVLHIFDGGIYDNLGMEPFFDIGTQKMRNDGGDFLLVSDAGSPLTRMEMPALLTKERIGRIFEITMDQTRALRIRAFINFLKRNPSKGMYVQIGADPRTVAHKYQDRVNSECLILFDWLLPTEIQNAKYYPTDLSIVNESEFELISRHGYETAKWNYQYFCNNRLEFALSSESEEQ